jgi:hypothetical protein
MMLRIERVRHDDLRRLHPAYFAIVMATGILALGAHEHSVPVLPGVLFRLNVFFTALSAADAADSVRQAQARPSRRRVETSVGLMNLLGVANPIERASRADDRRKQT